jgi:hypothetical protein
MRDRVLLFVLAMSLSAAAQAQVFWQPTPAPIVTAENTPWFTKGEPVYWNGHLYYPSGAQKYFDAYQMVRTGSFNGIPLYIDRGAVPDGVVYVPLPGGLMQPYERPQTGEIVTASSIPPAPPTPAGVIDDDDYDDVDVDLEPPPDTVATLRGMSEPMAVGTSGRIVARRALRAQASANPAPLTVSTLIPPAGLNGIWVNYDGRRWFLAGKAIDYDSSTLAEVGMYHGWRVYTRNGDPTTIYIPTTPGRLAPYMAR